MSQQARGRWEDTQRWVLGQLDELMPGDQAALLLMEPEPVVAGADDRRPGRMSAPRWRPPSPATIKPATPVRCGWRAKTLAKTAAEDKNPRVGRRRTTRRLARH